MAAVDDAVLAGALLTTARIVPICGLLVMLTRAVVPWPVGLSLAISLATSFHAPVELPLRASVLVPACARELAVGLVFAVATLLPVLTLGWAARLVELSLLPAPRPGPLARLYALVAAATFVGLSGHRALLMALSASFRDLPLGPLALDHATWALGVAQLVGEAFAFAFALALPLLVSLWVAQAAVALVGRALGARPEALDAPVRGPLAVLLAALLLAPLSAQVPDAVRAGLGAARDVIQRMGP